MHTELKALLDEHAAPTHASKADIHSLARPILAIGSKAQMQAAVYRMLFTDAKHAPHDPKLDMKLNGINGALGSAEDAVKAFRVAGDKLTDAFTALERYLVDAKVDLERYDAAQAVPQA